MCAPRLSLGCARDRVIFAWPSPRAALGRFHITKLRQCMWHVASGNVCGKSLPQLAELQNMRTAPVEQRALRLLKISRRHASYAQQCHVGRSRTWFRAVASGARRTFHRAPRGEPLRAPLPRQTRPGIPRLRSHYRVLGAIPSRTAMLPWWYSKRSQYEARETTIIHVFIVACFARLSSAAMALSAVGPRGGVAGGWGAQMASKSCRSMKKRSTWLEATTSKR